MKTWAINGVAGDRVDITVSGFLLRVATYDKAGGFFWEALVPMSEARRLRDALTDALGDEVAG